ncbi:MAG TPA: long-chain fatty acid--CoA ligase [Terriglobales bacterium]|nr:long-chain fatty acid--CoA ligase [Terriglobales bacterium]
MNLRTANDVFFSIIERDLSRVMMQREAIDWVPISAGELSRNVYGIAEGLVSWGISRGDRVAILSENRPEWTTADFAILLMGAITVPVYSTLTDQQVAYILADSGARVVFVSTEKQLQKVLAIQGQTRVEKVVVMDGVQTAHAFSMQRLMTAGPRNSTIAMQKEAASVTQDDPASIIYTSGTTGTPKGAILTHGNLASNLSCSLAGFDAGPGDISVSFLPLSHVTARHVDFSLLYHGVTLAYCPFIDQLARALQEVKPTIFVGVPRVYEKIHEQTIQKTRTFPKNVIYRWAVSVGKKHRTETLGGRKPAGLGWKIADKLVFSKIRGGLGGRVRILISGGAPLGREVAEWYASVGVRIYEGYGLTETSPVIAVNNPKAHKIGTVGKPLPNIEVRIADDGELLVRGPSVFREYWNRPEDTRQAFVDGWFKTGDIAHLDEDGFLVVTDRKKDLIKTSGGKFIAPQPLENSLKHNALIAEAVVVGEKRKFPAVLVAPHFPMLEEWARKNQVSFASRAELVANPRVKALYSGIVGDLNQNLARFEKLKKVIVIAEEFSIETGTLTPTMKLRRRVVEERYREQIERLYAQAGSERLTEQEPQRVTHED